MKHYEKSGSSVHPLTLSLEILVEKGTCDAINGRVHVLGNAGTCFYVWFGGAPLLSHLRSLLTKARVIPSMAVSIFLAMLAGTPVTAVLTVFTDLHNRANK